MLLASFLDKNMSFTIHMGLNGSSIGKAKVSLRYLNRGLSTYSVVYATKDGTKIETTVKHKRSDGALRLTEIVSRKLRKEVEKYYSYPDNIVVDFAGFKCIMCKDIPSRFKKQLAKDRPCDTGAIINGEPSMYKHDLDDWIEMKLNGKNMPFD